MTHTPGSPVGISLAASRAHHVAHTLRDLTNRLHDSFPHGWQGAAAHACASSDGELVARATRLQHRIDDVGTILMSYARALEEADAAAAAAQAHSQRILGTTPLGVLDAFGIAEKLAAEAAHLRALSSAQSAAHRCATDLMSLASASADAGSQHWWDPLGWWDDASVPDEDVSEDALEDTVWDPAYVQQGAIGDCYALSSLMGYMRTDSGRAVLESNVRWDDEANGYWVTLYVDGAPTEYFVDHVYEQGVDQYDGNFLWWEKTSPNVVSLYEAALAQATSYGDIDDGGTADEAMRLISGGNAQMHDFSHRGDMSGDLDPMRAALSDNSPVVASSHAGIGVMEMGSATIERPDGTVVHEDVSIVRSHAYEVERIDPDGTVWVRNPWGPGNSADGGGLIGLSKTQFSSAFLRAAYEETT